MGVKPDWGRGLQTLGMLLQAELLRKYEEAQRQKEIELRLGEAEKDRTFRKDLLGQEYALREQGNVAQYEREWPETVTGLEFQPGVMGPVAQKGRRRPDFDLGEQMQERRYRESQIAENEARALSMSREPQGRGGGGWNATADLVTIPIPPQYQAGLGGQTEIQVPRYKLDQYLKLFGVGPAGGAGGGRGGVQHPTIGETDDIMKVSPGLVGQDWPFIEQSGLAPQFYSAMGDSVSAGSPLTQAAPALGQQLIAGIESMKTDALMEKLRKTASTNKDRAGSKQSVSWSDFKRDLGATGWTLGGLIKKAREAQAGVDTTGSIADRLP